MKKVVYTLITILLMSNFLLGYEVEKGKGVHISSTVLEKNNKEIEKFIKDYDNTKKEYLRNALPSVSQNIINDVLYEIDYRIRDNVRFKINDFYNQMTIRVVDSLKSTIQKITYTSETQAFVLTETKINDFEQIIENFNKKYEDKLKETNAKNFNVQQNDNQITQNQSLQTQLRTQQEEVDKMIEVMDEIIADRENIKKITTIQLLLIEKINGVWMPIEIK